jgi:hypothetical protein
LAEQRAALAVAMLTDEIGMDQFIAELAGLSG